MKYSIVLAVLLAACGGSPTAPVSLAGDPTALIRNGSASELHWYWYDGSTRSGVDTILPHTTRCERFTAQADSARWFIARADSLTLQGWYSVNSNWFDPTARPAWTLDAFSASNLIVKDTTAIPC